MCYQPLADPSFRKYPLIGRDVEDRVDSESASVMFKTMDLVYLRYMGQVYVLFYRENCRVMTCCQQPANPSSRKYPLIASGLKVEGWWGDRKSDNGQSDGDGFRLEPVYCSDSNCHMTSDI